MQQQCPNCQNPINDTQKFCGKCSTQLKCKSCSTPLAADDANCTECGVERAPQKIASNSKNTFKLEKDGEKVTLDATFSDEMGKDVVQMLQAIAPQFDKTKMTPSLLETNDTTQKEQPIYTEDIAHEVVSDAQQPAIQNEKQELTPPKKTPASSKKTSSTTKKITSSSKKSKSPNNPEMDSSINFYPKGKESLEDYCRKYNFLDSKTKSYRILIIAFWFEEVLQKSKISLNELYTAFKHFERDIILPKRFKQYLIDNATIASKQYLERDGNDYSLTQAGKTLFNHKHPIRSQEKNNKK